MPNNKIHVIHVTEVRADNPDNEERHMDQVGIPSSSGQVFIHILVKRHLIQKPREV